MFNAIMWGGLILVALIGFIVAGLLLAAALYRVLNSRFTRWLFGEGDSPRL